MFGELRIANPVQISKNRKVVRKTIILCAVFGLAVGVLFLGAGWYTGLMPRNIWVAVAIPVISLLFTEVGGLIHIYLDSQAEMENRHLRELAKKDYQLEEANRLSEERNKLARELHDSIAQGIHGIIYTAHTLRNHLTKEEVEEGEVLGILDHLEKTAGMTLSELRAMTLELTPSELAEKGLKEALGLHCELFAHRQGITVETDIQTMNGLSSAQEIAIYRIAQEALTNIQKHSGANLASVSLKPSGDRIKLVITDNGLGFDARTIRQGKGLSDMADRAKANGGSFTISSATGKGSVVEVEFLKENTQCDGCA